MKIYIFNGDIYCKPCGEGIAAALPNPDAWEIDHPDSTIYPVAFDSSEGETDSPDHCGECNLFLERRLTEDGILYVQMEMALDNSDGTNDIINEWADFYDIENTQ